MALKDVIGQDRAIGILFRTLGRGRVPSAYIFTGESGIGKMLTAVNFAKAVNCQEPVTAFGTVFRRSERDNPLPSDLYGRDACDSCPSCRKIDAGTHPDLLIVAPEKNEIRVNEIRAVEDSLSMKPYEGKKKVVIIEDADTMNQAAANAFLKTLEEPPDESLIILVASSHERLPETIRSRCSCVKFAPLSATSCEEVIRRFGDHKTRGKSGVITGGGASVTGADALPGSLVKLAMGRPGLALGSDLIKERENFIGLLKGMIRGDNEVWKDREEMEQWFDMAATALRDIALLKFIDSDEILFNADIKSELSDMGKKADIPSILEAYGRISRLKEKLDFNLNKSITWNYTASVMRAVLGA